jgi:hypothetical protein
MVPKAMEVKLELKGPGNRLYHPYIRRPLSFHPILERSRLEERLLVVLE